MKSRNSIFFIAGIILSIFLVSCTSYTVENSDKKNYSQGNTNGNIHSDGILLVDKDWIYYTNVDASNCLYKKRLDGSDEKQLTKGHYSCQLNLINDWIYYTSGIPGEVYKVDINGKYDMKIIDKKVGNLIVTQDNIFYRLSFDNNWGELYKADLEGKNEIMLSSSIIEFAFYDGWLYYSNREDNGSLYKMDIHGENITKLNNQYSSYINVAGDYIYYIDYYGGQKLYRSKIDGTDKTLLSKEICGGINLNHGYIYYRNQTQRGRIYSMKVDGSENKVIIDKENCVALNVTDSFLVYRIPESTGGYFKANLDGSNTIKWATAY